MTRISVSYQCKLTFISMYPEVIAHIMGEFTLHTFITRIYTTAWKITEHLYVAESKVYENKFLKDLVQRSNLSVLHLPKPLHK